MTLSADNSESRVGLLRLSDEVDTDIFLDPGEYFVGDERYTVRTLLGSCVSIVLWHSRMRYGAISHFLLPTRRKDAPSERMHCAAAQLDGKYADEALELMIRQLEQAEVPLHGCVAKIFGGGNMFPGQNLSSKLDVGKRNGAAARRLLHERGLLIVAEDLFGNGHRSLRFDLHKGDVWVRHTSPIND